MSIKNKIIISENNFTAKVGHLKDDMYLYHYLNDDDFKYSNSCQYYLAILYKGKLYDIGSRSIMQFKNEYSFENAIQETLELIMKQDFNCTVENYVQVIIKLIQDKKWVMKWILSIILDYDKENNTNYYQEGLKIREDIRKQKDMEFQERERLRKEREEQEKKRILEERKAEQEARAKENFCNGFIDNLSPMRQQRVADILNKMFRYDGEAIRTRKDNVLVYLRNGYLPKEVEEVSYKKDENYDWVEKRKNVFALEKDNAYLVITKTEYDYASYLLEYGLEKAKLSNEIEKGGI